MDLLRELLKKEDLPEDVRNILKEHIRKQKHIINRYKTLFTVCRDAAFLADESGTIIDANHAAGALLQKPVQEIIGSHQTNLHPPEDMKHYAIVFREHLETGGSSPVTAEIITSTGDKVPVEINAAVIKENGKNLIYGLFRNVTEQKKYQKELEEAIIEGERANRAKSRFLAQMSHELRTPLNPILGLSEFMQELETDPEKLEMLHTLHNCGKHLLGLLNDILDFSKIEANKMTLISKPFSLTKLLDELQKLFIIKIREKGLEWVLDIGKSIPEELQGDRQRVLQIFSNIVSNAVKFTESGKITLSFDYQEQVLHAKIIDTGVGISPKNIRHLFNPFEQLETDRYVKKEGTGLGLAICQRLTQLMDGSIEVSSVVNQGTTFWLQIPLPSTK